MEKWNAYTKDGKLTDVILIRGEKVPEGLFHLACEVLVRHVDGSFLCMKRSVEKTEYPGYYEATAGGAAVIGEDKLMCIKRELKEETGISCEEFTEVCLSVSDGLICYSFVCVVDCDKNSVTLQEGETEGYKWMSEAEFKEFVNSPKMIPIKRKRYLKYFETTGIIK